MAETIGMLGRRNDEAAAAARAAQTRSDATAAAVATLAQKLPAGVAVERSQVEALAARVAAVETSEKTAAAERRSVPSRGWRWPPPRSERAVERGDPFAAELAAAKALGADPKLTRRARAVRGRRRADASRARARARRARAVAAPGRRRRRRARGFLDTAAAAMPRSWCACVRSTRPPAAMPPRSRRASRLKARAGRYRRRAAPSSPSCSTDGARAGRGLDQAGAGAHRRARRQPPPRRRRARGAGQVMREPRACCSSSPSPAG